MAYHFEATPGGGAAVALDEVEISILRSLAVQLLELIGPGDTPADGEDPLAALFAEGPSKPPSDPALARLFPDAYGGPDRPAEGGKPEEELRELSSEFRRFTENDLRSGKRDDAVTVVRTLDALSPTGDGGAVLTLTGDECRSLAPLPQRPAPDHRHPAGGLRRGRGRRGLALPAPRHRSAQAHGDGLPLARRTPGNARRNADAVMP